MWTNVFKFLINIALVLLRHKSEQKQVNEEVYQEIKETPEPNKVEPLPLIQEPVNQPKQMKEFKIIQKLLPPSQYVQDSKFVPKSIVLHHTNGHSAQSTFNYWLSNKERIATHFLIDRDGSIYQCIPLDKCWGYHLYVAAPDNKISREYKKLASAYDKQSIGIELCNISQLVPYENKFLDTYGKVFKDHSKITKLDKPFRGYEYWESYTKEQLDSLEFLLLDLIDNYPIIGTGLKDDYSNEFDISLDALNMKPGVYFHVNYRTGTKWDLYPHPELIKMLNNLKNKI